MRAPGTVLEKRVSAITHEVKRVQHNMRRLKHLLRPQTCLNIIYLRIFLYNIKGSTSDCPDSSEFSKRVTKMKTCISQNCVHIYAYRKSPGLDLAVQHGTLVSCMQKLLINNDSEA